MIISVLPFLVSKPSFPYLTGMFDSSCIKDCEVLRFEGNLYRWLRDIFPIPPGMVIPTLPWAASSCQEGWTTLLVKKFFLKFFLNLPWHNLRLLLSLFTREKRPIPKWVQSYFRELWKVVKSSLSLSFSSLNSFPSLLLFSGHPPAPQSLSCNENPNLSCFLSLCCISRCLLS